ncbi:hypothetical protein HK102_013388 [Quaeritorhiza haematococci]|nr:hypothetical protein HK102_013388 [Quaeritorhiza haematococci]
MNALTLTADAPQSPPIPSGDQGQNTNDGSTTATAVSAQQDSSTAATPIEENSKDSANQDTLSKSMNKVEEVKDKSQELQESNDGSTTATTVSAQQNSSTAATLIEENNKDSANHDKPTESSNKVEEVKDKSQERQESIEQLRLAIEQLVERTEQRLAQQRAEFEKKRMKKSVRFDWPPKVQVFKRNSLLGLARNNANEANPTSSGSAGGLTTSNQTGSVINASSSSSSAQAPTAPFPLRGILRKQTLYTQARRSGRTYSTIRTTRTLRTTSVSTAPESETDHAFTYIAFTTMTAIGGGILAYLFFDSML